MASLLQETFADNCNAKDVSRRLELSAGPTRHARKATWPTTDNWLKYLELQRKAAELRQLIS